MAVSIPDDGVDVFLIIVAYHLTDWKATQITLRGCYCYTCRCSRAMMGVTEFSHYNSHPSSKIM